ncbi:MAG: branched-chain amino acid ABC transporter [Epsilonproteobacteria bacterium]|nr:branched-chain amino acid ABC transporter [Campylobacterota bacterium]
MQNSYLISGIVIAVIATYMTRLIPFLFFAKRKPSPMIRYIEWNMPLMIMVILVFYALKDVKWAQYPYGMAEIIGVAVAILIHLKFNNALLSIIISTMTYMFLIQKVFV